MRNYELVLVISPDPAEKEREDLLAKIQKKLLELKAEVTKTEILGRKTLTYPIKKKEMGFFFHWLIKLEPEQVKEFEDYLKLEEALLRFLLVGQEK